MELSNNWAQITYHLGTAQEQSKLYNLDDYNDKLSYKLEYVDNFCPSKKRDELAERISSRLKAFEEEAIRRERMMESIDWNKRYTI